MNPGFSSTTGVQIAMTRFSNVTYNAAAQTAEVGAGLIWDDVYSSLAAFNVSVVGGRVTGVGVAGFTLGGGRCRFWRSSAMCRIKTIRVFVEDKSIRSDYRQRGSVRVGVPQWNCQ